MSRRPSTSTLFPYTTLFRSYLKSLSAEFTERKFSEGQELTAEGSGGAGFFVIESGTARVTENRSEEHTSELQSRVDLVCRLLLEKKKEATITSRATTGSARG